MGAHHPRVPVVVVSLGAVDAPTHTCARARPVRRRGARVGARRDARRCFRRRRRRSPRVRPSSRSVHLRSARHALGCRFSSASPRLLTSPSSPPSPAGGARTNASFASASARPRARTRTPCARTSPSSSRASDPRRSSSRAQRRIITPPRRSVSSVRGDARVGLSPRAHAAPRPRAVDALAPAAHQRRGRAEATVGTRAVGGLGTREASRRGRGRGGRRAAEPGGGGGPPLPPESLEAASLEAASLEARPEHSRDDRVSTASGDAPLEGPDASFAAIARDRAALREARGVPSRAATPPASSTSRPSPPPADPEATQPRARRRRGDIFGGYRRVRSRACAPRSGERRGGGGPRVGGGGAPARAARFAARDRATHAANAPREAPRTPRRRAARGSSSRRSTSSDSSSRRSARGPRGRRVSRRRRRRRRISAFSPRRRSKRATMNRDEPRPPTFRTRTRPRRRRCFVCSRGLCWRSATRPVARRHPSSFGSRFASRRPPTRRRGTSRSRR